VALQTLMELVVPRLGDWAVVALLGDDRRPTESARAHSDPARVADMDAYLDRPDPGEGDQDSPMAAAFYTGEPIAVHPIPPELVEQQLTDDDVRAAWQRLDTDSFVIVPLRARGETFGGLVLLNTRARGPHSEMEIATTVEVARRAGLALDNARLYGQQLKVAETLQRSLLTPPPQPDDLEIAVRYQPAAINMHVGGDWYDAFQQPDGATLLVIGDVVGHNVDAAAAMGQIRSIVRGIAFDRQEDPARVLARVDEVLTGLRIGTLATALIARIEQTPEEREQSIRRLRWSSAGHLPPLVLHADGTVDTLASHPEPLLGAETTHPRTDHVARLRPGDTVVFYTDGLVEQGRTTIDDGMARLVGVLAEVGDGDPDQLCDRLLERIVARRSEDDVAIIAVRCHPQH
jgi:sigma-B regulation protein RsbU (phosphoserine phosphatase)